MFVFPCANILTFSGRLRREIADDQRAMSVRQGNLRVRGSGRANGPVHEMWRERTVSCTAAPTRPGPLLFLCELVALHTGYARGRRAWCRGCAGPQVAAPW